MKTLEQHKEKMKYTYKRIRGRKNHHKRKLSLHELKIIECREEGWGIAFNNVWSGYHLQHYKKYEAQQNLLGEVLNIIRS